MEHLQTADYKIREKYQTTNRPKSSSWHLKKFEKKG